MTRTRKLTQRSSKTKLRRKEKKKERRKQGEMEKREEEMSMKLSSPFVEPTLPPFFFLLFCWLAECLSPGQPTYHYGNLLNHREMHKKPCRFTGDRPAAISQPHILTDCHEIKSPLPTLQPRASHMHTHKHIHIRLNLQEIPLFDADGQFEKIISMYNYSIYE